MAREMNEGRSGQVRHTRQVNRSGVTESLSFFDLSDGFFIFRVYLGTTSGNERERVGALWDRARVTHLQFSQFLLTFWMFVDLPVGLVGWLVGESVGWRVGWSAS